jgi:hypothetical protein
MGVLIQYPRKEIDMSKLGEERRWMDGCKAGARVNVESLESGTGTVDRTQGGVRV